MTCLILSLGTNFLFWNKINEYDLTIQDNKKALLSRARIMLSKKGIGAFMFGYIFSQVNVTRAKYDHRGF